NPQPLMLFRVKQILWTHALLRAFVEWRSYDFCFHLFASYKDLKSGADGGPFRRQVCQADIFLQGDGGRSTRHVSRFASIYKSGVTIARDLFSHHLESDESASHAFLLLFEQGLTADEFMLVELYD